MEGIMRITGQVRELKENEIFVFGSNLSGRHGKGAAKQAMRWGAKYGQASGLQGRTYGIPTVNATITGKLTIHRINVYVQEFIKFAKEHPELHFLVTAVGCGLAGWTAAEIAPLFLEATVMKNVSLPREFWKEYTK
jgi:hypothetical protein